MAAKDITEMTDEELQAEIMRLQTTHIPSAPGPKRPRRVDETKAKRKSVFDLLEES